MLFNSFLIAVGSSFRARPMGTLSWRSFPLTGWWALALILLGMLSVVTTPAHAAGIYTAANMSEAQFRKLDHANTVVILVGGNFEEHGPYIPANIDGIVSDKLAADLADRLVEHGYDVLLFPPIPLASSPVNEIPGIYPWPGSYNLRYRTVRTLYMDLATELGTDGYKYIFQIHMHGGPNYRRALNQASQYFNDTFHGHMVPLTGSGPGIELGPDPYDSLSDEAISQDAHSGHGGITETSLALFICPDDVDPAYANAPSFPPSAENGGMPGVAKREGWPGYFGAPRYSSAELGAKLYYRSLKGVIEQALGTLDGTYKPGPTESSPLRALDKAALQHDDSIEQQEQRWIKANVPQELR